MTSFHWLNNDEIGLVVNETISEERATKTFWRQNISKGPETRKQIFQDTTKPELRYGIGPFNDYPQEFWSPKGKFVIYIYPDFDCLKILDVARETIEIAKLGLKNRARPGIGGMVPDERHFLNALQDSVEEGKAPADELLERYHGDWNGDLKRIYADYSY